MASQPRLQPTTFQAPIRRLRAFVNRTIKPPLHKRPGPVLVCPTTDVRLAERKTGRRIGCFKRQVERPRHAGKVIVMTTCPIALKSLNDRARPGSQSVKQHTLVQKFVQDRPGQVSMGHPPANRDEKDRGQQQKLTDVVSLEFVLKRRGRPIVFERRVVVNRGQGQVQLLRQSGQITGVQIPARLGLRRTLREQMNRSVVDHGRSVANGGPSGKGARTPFRAPECYVILWLVIVMSVKERSDEVSWTYMAMMDNEGVLVQKASDIAGAVRPGVIVDHGCSSGQLLNHLKGISPDSTCVGVDYAEMMLDLGRREFSDRVEFVRADIMDHTLDNPDTIICSSTLHELWSHALPDRSAATERLRTYFEKVYSELDPNGRFVLRGVGTPENGERLVRLELSTDDGLNTDNPEAPAGHLSTNRRFQRFCSEFQPASTYEAPVERVNEQQWCTSLQFAWEFALTKDYVNVWEMEMHEEFCFLPLPKLAAMLKDAGFHVPVARSYVNPWIRKNRLSSSLILYDLDGRRLDYPPTNYVVRAER